MDPKYIEGLLLNARLQLGYVPWVYDNYAARYRRPDVSWQCTGFGGEGLTRYLTIEAYGLSLRICLGDLRFPFVRQGRLLLNHQWVIGPYGQRALKILMPTRRRTIH